MSYQLLKKQMGLPEEENTILKPAGAAPLNMAGPGAQALFTAAAPKPGLDSAGAGGAGWVNLQRVLGVNQQQGQQMAGGLASNVAQQGAPLDAQASQMKFGTTQATGEQLGQAANVSQQAKQLVDFSGRRDLLAQQNAKEGGTGYSAGMGRFDSFLSGAAGGQQLRNTAEQFGGLSERMGLASQLAGENALDAAAFAAHRPPVAPILTSEPPPAAHGTGATTRKIIKRVY